MKILAMTVNRMRPGCCCCFVSLQTKLWWNVRAGNHSAGTKIHQSVLLKVHANGSWCVMGVPNLAEGGDPLGELRLHLGERLGFADGLLELLLGELEPLLQLPVLLLRLIEKEKHIGHAQPMGNQHIIETKGRDYNCRLSPDKGDALTCTKMTHKVVQLDYFPTTARLRVFYSSYTTVTCAFNPFIPMSMGQVLSCHHPHKSPSLFSPRFLKLASVLC